MRLLILNGPNLNNQGKREPDIYGTETLADLREKISRHAREVGWEVDFFQSNHEGSLIDKIQEVKDIAGLIINPGGLTHSSVSLRDALAAVEFPVVEVHISNIFSREEFRRHSLISPVVKGIVCGLGIEGYLLAFEFLRRTTHLPES